VVAFNQGLQIFVHFLGSLDLLLVQDLIPMPIVVLTSVEMVVKVELDLNLVVILQLHKLQLDLNLVQVL
jgi:hypothetical protein